MEDLALQVPQEGPSVRDESIAWMEAEMKRNENEPSTPIIRDISDNPDEEKSTQEPKTSDTDAGKELRADAENEAPQANVTSNLSELSAVVEKTTNSKIRKYSGSSTTGNPSSPGIHSLPMDALHFIAGFMTPYEWCNGFGIVHRANCREIIRRVKMHAFKCATEVIATWKMGQRADARELAALYIAAGVPIYSRCLGHSYHTVYWRMNVEARETDRKKSASSSPPTAATGNPPATEDVTDPFFHGKVLQDRNNLENSKRHFTYLEEKCLFTADRFSAGSASSDEEVAPKVMPVKLHHHLLDQHILGNPAIKDENGKMQTPMVSLSADFFHPNKKSGKPGKQELNQSFQLSPSEPPAEDDGPNYMEQWSESPTDTVHVLQPLALPEGTDDERVEDDNDLDEMPSPPSSLPTGEVIKSVLNSVDLEVYSSVTSSSEESKEIQRHMRSRFLTYQRRLDTFLVKGDHNGFDECMLDLWDEFFPHTAGIHYFDLETAVPRMSCMKKFLTKPCPRAIGTVQCEIERIRINPKGKGVSMKGRLFPTYEYRLFIRNRPPNAIGDSPESASTAEPEGFVRRDTVLMVAKNRGRKHTESNGVLPMTAVTKKGSNNYYLYMPQQIDVDEHFETVNEKIDKPARFVSNGAGYDPVIVSDDSSSILLGRLQSNFIGTEFQIFTPRLRKLPRRKADLSSTSQPFGCSDNELDYDSGGGMSSDNASFRRSRFGRLTMRRSIPPNSDMSTGSNESSLKELTPVKKSPVKRAYSSPDMQQHGGASTTNTSSSTRQTRTNRRAIANDAVQKQPHSAWVEEEDGGIIYTANLLGSRPRIMDVCIPRVSDGVAGSEWKRYLESCDDTDECRMLSCFRQMQQNRENPELNQEENANNNNDDDSDDEENDETPDFGLMGLQNRPPWWNAELNSFVLNFGGRVSVASVKNFQLCERSDQDTIMLQFGRIKGRHAFTMDFQHPLTAVQAFSIAISSLQSKISFG